MKNLLKLQILVCFIVTILCLYYLHTYNFNNYTALAYVGMFSFYNNYLYVLGTNKYGMDLTYIVVNSLSKAIFFGLITGTLSVLLALILGIIKGYYARKIDTILQRIYEILISIPIVYMLLMLSSTKAITREIIILVTIVFNSFLLLPYIRTITFQQSHSPFINTLKQASINNKIIITKYLMPIVAIKLKFVIVFAIFSNIIFFLLLDFLTITNLGGVNYKSYSSIFLESIKDTSHTNLLVTSFVPILLLSVLCIKIIKFYDLKIIKNPLKITNLNIINTSNNNIIIGESGSGKTQLLNALHQLQSSFILPQKINELYSPNIKINQHFSFTNLERNIVKLFKLNVNKLQNNYKNSFSLGELQWIALCFTISNKDSKLILLDEPFAFLDADHQNKLVDILTICSNVYNKKFTLTIHNNNLAFKLSSSLYNTELFKVVKVVNNITVCKTNILKKQDSATPALPGQGEPLLTINSMPLKNKSMLTASIITTQINLVIGSNGSGKSTLLNTLYNNLKYNVANNNITNHVKADNIGYLPQEYSKILHNNFKIITIIKEVAKKHLRTNKDIIKFFKLLNFSYSDIKLKSANQISLGQLHKICFLIVLLQNNTIIILDEPTSSLDEKNNLQLINLINNLNKNLQITFIIANHHLLTNNNLNVNNIINLDIVNN